MSKLNRSFHNLSSDLRRSSSAVFKEKLIPNSTSKKSLGKDLISRKITKSTVSLTQTLGSACDISYTEGIKSKNLQASQCVNRSSLGSKTIFKQALHKTQSHEKLTKKENPLIYERSGHNRTPSHNSKPDLKSPFMNSKSKHIKSFSTSFNNTIQPPISSLVDSSEDQSRYESKLGAVKAIEKRMQEELKALSARCPKAIDDSIKLPIYKQAFEEIVNLDLSCSSVLNTIKSFYDKLVEALMIDSYRNKYEQAEKELQAAHLKLHENSKEIKYLMRKVEKFIKEAADLSRELEYKENKYVELKNHVCSIAKASLASIPQDEIGWKMLVTENKSYEQLVNNLEEELRSYKAKQKKLVKLLLALKRRGYPIEEVYEQDVNILSKSKTTGKPFSTSQISSEASYSGQITRPSESTVKRPDCVPPLKLELAHKDFTSDEESCVPQDEAFLFKALSFD
jgi:hypothetical protein